ncbi:MAG: AAA family ATPase [Pseudomonadota bacterium]
MTGRVILLNGSSSSGKTTLSTTLQRVLPEHWQHVALDQFRDGMPGRARGLNSPPDTPGAAGLNIVPVVRDGRAMTEIRFGAFGEVVLAGMRRSVRALAQASVDVIVDDLLFKPDYLTDYRRALSGIDTWFVGVRCPLPVVEAREATRVGRFPGTAASHFDAVHAHGSVYDVEVDTSVLTPRACAEIVRERLREPPRAFANGETCP